MRAQLIVFGGLAVMGLLTGCETLPPGTERGPDGTIAYNVLIEASEPGVKIQANGQDVGVTPLTLKIWGDRDGTFHDFGSYYYIIEAFPLHTNQFVQTAMFRTGHLFTPEDYIPRRIYFDMNKPPPANPPSPAYYGTPGYYGPSYYGPSIYFGPPIFYRHHYHRRW